MNLQLLKRLLFLIFIFTMLLPQRLLKYELRRQSCLKEYYDYTKAMEKLDNCTLRISFFEKCRDSVIIPKFLKFRVPNNGCFNDSSVKDFQRRLLHQEISKAKSTLKECCTRMDETRELLKSKVPEKCLAY